MRLRLFLTFVALLFFVSPGSAQEDALNLPTELYVLTDAGQVERYGQGALGVAAVTPEGEIVTDFGVAPDGIWLAYRTGEALSLLNMATGEARAIEGPTSGAPPFRGRGQTIAWSPNGEVLAYTVDTGLRFYFNIEPPSFLDAPTTPIMHLDWSPDGTYVAAETENNIWWVYRREGSQMLLHAALPPSIGIAWVDNHVLMFAPDTGGLFLMDLAQANAQAQIADTDIFFRLPAARNIGDMVVFAREADDTSILETAGYLTSVNFAQGGPNFQQLSESSVDLAALQWAPKGTLLVTLKGGVLALVDPNSAQGFALPMTGVVAYGWGAIRPQSTANMALSTFAYFVATDITGARSVWQLSQNGTPPTPITPPEIAVETLAVAPDGETLAYTADGQIWLLGADTNEAVALAEVANVGSLVFTPDATALIYDSEGAIYSLPAVAPQASEGEEAAPQAQPTQILNGYTAPRYSPDGSTLLVRIADGDAGLYNPTTGEVRRLGAFDDVLFMRDGRIVARGAPTQAGVNGLYLIDATGGAPSLLFAAPSGGALLDLTESNPGQARIIIGRRGAPGKLQVYDVPVAGGQSLLLAEPGYIGQPRLSPDGRMIAGISSATGTLMVYDLVGGRETLYSETSRLGTFIWSAP